jgi:bifunctional non-homologous end joining protein LigD
MPLDKYLEKRSFTKTHEPTGGKSNADKLTFVVQKHAASHMHYDFRLEFKGVLKSWAVPKGPSMNPAEHRLAMEVEDHPFDYKDFEGIIPKGQYGGGTVIIWDQGTYEPVEKLKTKKEQEHWMTSHYYKNSIRIIMKGKKLKGEFFLERIRERGDNSWLLTKVDDKYASTEDISKKDKSVVSGLTIEAMSGNGEATVWQSNREQKISKKEKQIAAEITEPAGRKKAFPDKLEPMLSTLVREPFTDEDWLYEVSLTASASCLIKIRARSL